MIDGKQLQGGAASRAHNGGERARHGGRDKGKGARLRTVGGGDIGGGERRQEQGWKAGRHDEAKRFGVSEWCGCSSSRVRIYIAAIYSIFIYILSIYL